MALYFRRQELITDSIGGYFLKDLTAEWIISRLERKIAQIIGASNILTKKDISNLIKNITPDERYTDFVDKLENGTLRGMLRKYEDWHRNEPNAARQVSDFFQLFSNVLQFEVNKVYKPWYKKLPEPELSLTDLDCLRRILEELLSEGRISKRDAHTF